MGALSRIAPAREGVALDRDALIALIMEETTDDIVADGWKSLGKPNVLVQGCRYIRRNAPAGTDGYANPEASAKQFAGFIADRILSALNTHPAAPSADKLRIAVEDIAAERQRQIDSEKRSEASDDLYIEGELARGAVAYALAGSGLDHAAAGGMWPVSWHYSWWKPTTPRRDLVKAGALIVAEIERIDRAALEGVTA